MRSYLRLVAVLIGFALLVPLPAFAGGAGPSPSPTTGTTEVSRIQITQQTNGLWGLEAVSPDSKDPMIRGLISDGRFQTAMGDGPIAGSYVHLINLSSNELTIVVSRLVPGAKPGYWSASLTFPRWVALLGPLLLLFLATLFGILAFGTRSWVRLIRHVTVR